MIGDSKFGEVKKDFIYKLSIAQKEINEAMRWLELLESTEYLNINEY